MPVHLFGNVAPVPELSELGVPVLEDAAQAAGATLGGVRAGALGDAATFSFFPSKNLPCLGDGGAIATDSDEVAERARTLRFHGSRDKRTHTDVGYNSRLDSIQAAVLRVLLPGARRLERAPPRGRRRRTSARASASWCAPLRADRGGGARVPPLRGARRAGRRAGRGAERARDRGARLLPHARAPAGADARVRRARSCPPPTSSPGTILALPMGPELSTGEQVAAVVEACGARAGRERVGRRGGPRLLGAEPRP